MPILTLQRQQTEVGRIRIGQQVATSNGRTRPAKLDKFRITTPSRRLADRVAELFGGTVQPWKSPAGPQWEVFTDSASLPVIVPPQNPMTQWMELWSGGGCQRRCDGQRNVLTDTPCACPADPADRAELAADGQACKPTTRLNVMLAQVESVGVWRLESHGYYAAVELPGVADVLASAGGYIEGRLELQQRSVKRKKRNGSGMETRQYMVPVLDVNVAPVNLVELNAGHGAGAAQVTAGEQRQAIAAAPAGEPIDWAARIAAVDNPTSWRSLMAELQNGGELTPELEQAMRDRAEQIKASAAPAPAPTQQPAPTETVDAELVDEQEVDAKKVWQEVLLLAADRSWSTSQTQRQFHQHVGVNMVDATGAQLVQFRDHLKAGGN